MASSTSTAPIVIEAKRTSWIFVADSNEPRHLYDVVFAAHSLRSRGVDPGRIFVCTDHVGAAQHLDPYGITNRHSLSSLDTVLAQLECDVVVLTVGGHGNSDGIGSPVVLSPSALFAKVRTIPGLKAGIVVLTQCFAGIFNYVDAAAEPPLVLVGATALNNSVSASITLPAPIRQTDGSDGIREWSANLFSTHFFQWFSVRRDVDGDGALTLMDAFKYAGVHSNQQLIGVKSRAFVAATQLTNQLIKLADELKNAPAPATPTEMSEAMLRKMEFEATEKALQGRLNLIYLNQEPWILNAHLARKVVVDL